jgi:hypothetical protein
MSRKTDKAALPPQNELAEEFGLYDSAWVNGGDAAKSALLKTLSAMANIAVLIGDAVSDLHTAEWTAKHGIATLRMGIVNNGDKKRRPTEWGSKMAVEAAPEYRKWMKDISTEKGHLEKLQTVKLALESKRDMLLSVLSNHA